MTSEYFDYRVFGDGDKIFSEGERASEAFVIREGQVRITRNIDGAVKQLGLRKANTVIGEMGVISDLPRMATATAVGETFCCVFSRRVFQDLIEQADIETRSMVHFLVAFIRDAEVGKPGNAGRETELKNRARIARHLVDSEQTVELLKRNEPIFVVLCRSLIQRTVETLDAKSP